MPRVGSLDQQPQDSDPSSIQHGVPLTRETWRFDLKADYSRPNTRYKFIRTQVVMRQNRLDLGRGMTVLRAVELRVRQAYDRARQPHCPHTLAHTTATSRCAEWAFSPLAAPSVASAVQSQPSSSRIAMSPRRKISSSSATPTLKSSIPRPPFAWQQPTVHPTP